MGKLVRVLVFLFLALSIGSLILSTMLYMQKEVIRGRNVALENALITLGASLETGIEKDTTTPGFTAKDISPVSSEILTTPELSDFWDDYELYLETLDTPTLNLKERRQEIMSYYKKDAMGKDIKTITDGPGTLQGVIDDVTAIAEAQYNLLNKTRTQLKNVRVELTDTIEELNRVKADARRDKASIVTLNERISELETEVNRLNQQINLLQDEKATLEDEVAEKTRENATLLEEIAQKNDVIAELKKKMKKVLEDLQQPGIKQGAGPTIDPQAVANINSGEKGKVIAVNEEWDFIVGELNPDFVKQLTNLTPEGTVPALEVMIEDDQGNFVAKARLTQLKVAKNTAIFDVITDWQTAPIKIGDIIFK